MLTTIFRHPILLSLGLILIVLALYLTWRKHQILLTGHLADGEVVRLAPHSSSKGGPTYSSVVDYVDPSGKRTEFESSFSSSPPLHQVGEKVRVVYYQGAEKPDILNFADLYLFQWVSLCTGIFLLMMYVGFTFGPGVVNALYLPTLTNRW